MSKIIGIDLGTTNSCVACLDGKKVEVILNSEGEKTTPSAVAFKQTKDGGDPEIIVGSLAKRSALTNPDTILSIKRKMGTSEKVTVAGKSYSPEEISAMILQKLKRDTEDNLGESISDAVITVPAYFDDAQRNATKDAGTIAGLNVVRIINEPTAAALAYGLDQAANKKQKILIYDLGGGTFDVSVLELNDNSFEVLATNGNNFLGGNDWDEVLVDTLIQKFKDKHGINLEKDLMAVQRLKEEAEIAKKELSTLLETTIMLAFITANEEGALHLEEKITRQEFEDKTNHLLERTKEPIHNALADAGLDKEQIDEVLLVGGMTRMPAVTNLVVDQLGKTPNKKINPDEVVAVGAGIQGAILGGDIKDVLLLDVTPLSLGLETQGGVMFVLIKRNSTIPMKVKRRFSTAENNQTAVDIRVHQGEREFAYDNKLLGEFTLTGIPPAPKGVPEIEVTFDINANGILNVSAIDLKTNRVQSITISNSSNLSEEEVERMVKEADSNRERDAQRRENITYKISAQDALTRLQTASESDTLDLDPDEKEEIFRVKRDMQRAIDEEDFEMIRSKSVEVEDLINRLNDRISNSGQRATEETKTDEEFTTTEDAKDVDNEEIAEEEDFEEENEEDFEEEIEE